MSSSASQLTERPRMKSGDTVRVHVKIKEGDKERVQVFEGTVIGQHRGGLRASFTVRKVSAGQGVERIFPLHSPVIQKVEIVRSARVRRAKLYFLRDLKGKAARMKETKRPTTSLVVTVLEGVARPVTRHLARRTVENALGRLGLAHVAGVDEVGRGCLAGPVVAAAVVLDPVAAHRRPSRLQARACAPAATVCTTRSRAGPWPGRSPRSSRLKSIASTSIARRSPPCGRP